MFFTALNLLITFSLHEKSFLPSWKPGLILPASLEMRSKIWPRLQISNTPTAHDLNPDEGNRNKHVQREAAIRQGPQHVMQAVIDILLGKATHNNIDYSSSIWLSPLVFSNPLRLVNVFLNYCKSCCLQLGTEGHHMWSLLALVKFC